MKISRKSPPGTQPDQIVNLAGDKGDAFIKGAGQRALEFALLPHILPAIYALKHSATPDECMKRICETAGISVKSQMLPWNGKIPGKWKKVVYCTRWARQYLRNAGYLRSDSGKWVLTDFALQNRNRWLEPDSWPSFRDEMYETYKRHNRKNRRRAANTANSPVKIPAEQEQDLGENEPDSILSTTVSTKDGRSESNISETRSKIMNKPTFLNSYRGGMEEAIKVLEGMRANAKHPGDISGLEHGIARLRSKLDVEPISEKMDAPDNSVIVVDRLGNEATLLREEHMTLAGDKGFVFIKDARVSDLVREFIPFVLRAIYDLGHDAPPQDCAARVRTIAKITQKTWDIKWYKNQYSRAYMAICWAVRRLREAGYLSKSRGRGFHDLWTLTSKALDEKDLWWEPETWNAFRNSVRPSRTNSRAADSDNEVPEMDVEETKGADVLTIRDTLLRAINALDHEGNKAPDGMQVKKLVKIVVNHAGYVNCQITPQNDARGVDVWGYRPDGGLHQTLTAFQVKSGEHVIEAPVMDQFIGACGRNNNCAGVFVSIPGFSPPAEEYARQGNITMIDGPDLLQIMNQHGVWNYLSKVDGYSVLMEAKARVDGKKRA